jgi:hypothetical protein
MRSTTLALLLACLGTAACQSSSAPPASPSLKVHDGAGDTGPLHLAQIASLSVESTFAATPGSHAVRIDIIDPQGMGYGSVRNTVVVDPGGAAKVTQTLQVRGTTIEGYHRIGSWQFLLVVDDGRPLASTSVDIVD